MTLPRFLSSVPVPCCLAAVALALLCLGATPAFGQEGSGDALAWSAEPEQTLLGQPVIARTVYSTALGEVVDVEVDDMPAIQVSRYMADGSELAIEFVVYRVGRFESAGATVTVLAADGSQQTLRTAPFVMDVRSTIVNETNPEPAPSELPRAVMTPDRRPLVAGAVLLVLLIGAGVGAWFRGREREAEPAYVAPPRPAWELALERLDALEGSDMLEAGDRLGYHMRLSELLRAYVGDRFGIAAVEATTTEIAAALRGRPDEVGSWYPVVLRLLQEMDLVKFAKFVPPDDESRALLADTRRLVLDLSASEREREARAAEASNDALGDQEPEAKIDADAPEARSDEPALPPGSAALPAHIATMDFASAVSPFAALDDADAAGDEADAEDAGGDGGDAAERDAVDAGLDAGQRSAPDDKKGALERSSRAALLAPEREGPKGADDESEDTPQNVVHFARPADREAP